MARSVDTITSGAPKSKSPVAAHSTPCQDLTIANTDADPKQPRPDAAATPAPTKTRGLARKTYASPTLPPLLNTPQIPGTARRRRPHLIVIGLAVFGAAMHPVKRRHLFASFTKFQSQVLRTAGIVFPRQQPERLSAKLNGESSQVIRNHGNHQVVWLLKNLLQKRLTKNAQRQVLLATLKHARL